MNVFKTINNKINESKEKKRKKQEEELKIFKDKIEERKIEFKNILEDYEDYVKDKRSFYILLQDTNLQEIYYGTMTCYENYVELLPIDEGKTGIIQYNEIRKLKIEKCKIRDPTRISRAISPFKGIFITLYLHSGEKHVIEIYNRVTNYKVPSDYPFSVDPDGYLNYSSWFDTVGITRFQGLTEKYDDVVNTEKLKFYKYVLEIGCKMNCALENRVENLFKCNIEEVFFEYPFDF